MTTPAAAAAYLAEHQSQWGDKGFAVYNPESRPLEELPVIYGFNNGGSVGLLQGLLIAEDGTLLGAHACSDEGYMPHDLGILEGSRPDRHERFREHFPRGYRMDFVTYADVPGHEGLTEAVQRHKASKGERHESHDT